MKDDPIITEIRHIRHELSEKFGHNPRQLVKFFQEQEKLHADRLVYFRLQPQSRVELANQQHKNISINNQA